MNFQETLTAAKIIPVIKLESIESAAPLAKALNGGGLNVMEITFRTPCAAQAIARIKKEIPETYVIAGTVLTVASASQAIKAGADAIVAPGLNATVVRYCKKRKTPICPGVATATEINEAMAFGLKLVKFFPAEAMGGVSTVKALSAAFPGIQFMPTGGINENNIYSYLALPNVIACGGSYMVREDLLSCGNFAQIQRLAAAAKAAVMNLKCSR